MWAFVLMYHQILKISPNLLEPIASFQNQADRGPVSFPPTPKWERGLLKK